jgi:hypothetical protein
MDRFKSPPMTSGLIAETLCPPGSSFPQNQAPSRKTKIGNPVFCAACNKRSVAIPVSLMMRPSGSSDTKYPDTAAG